MLQFAEIFHPLERGILVKPQSLLVFQRVSKPCVFFLNSFFLSFLFALGEFMGFPKGLEILKLGDFRTDGDGDVLGLPPQKMQHIRLKVDEIVQMSKASDIHLLTCLQVSLSLSLYRSE